MRRKQTTYTAARQALSADEPVQSFRSPISELMRDRKAVAHLIRTNGRRWLEGAALLAGLGADVWLEGLLELEGTMYAEWKVSVPKKLADRIALVIFRNPGSRGPHSHVLHASTRHPGWQLTRYDERGEPWGHSEIREFSDAFKTGPMDSGESAGHVIKVFERDGTTHVPKRLPKQRSKPRARKPTTRKRTASAIVRQAAGG